MSAYIYALQPPSKTVTIRLPDGKITGAAILSFAYKPYLFGQGADAANRRLDKITVQPRRRAWANRAQPEYVVVGNPGELNGAPVMKWHPGWIAVIDEPNFGGLRTLGYYHEATGNVFEREQDVPGSGFGTPVPLTPAVDAAFDLTRLPG